MVNISENMNTKVEVKKCNNALRSFNSADARYISLCLEFRQGLESLVKDYGMTREQILRRFNVPKSKQRDFMLGAYNFSLEDMATLKVIFMEKQ